MFSTCLRYVLCMTAALVVAATSCGATLEHHCSHCAAAHTAHAHHGCCEQCDHCARCGIIHFDSTQTCLTPLLQLPSPESLEVLHCIVPIDGIRLPQCPLPENLHTGAPPDLKEKGRAVLRKIKKLVL